MWSECWILAERDGAALASQKVVHFLFPFRFKEDIEEDTNHSQEAGCGYHSNYQPCECRICEQRDTGRCIFKYRGLWLTLSSQNIISVCCSLDWLLLTIVVFTWTYLLRPQNMEILLKQSQSREWDAIWKERLTFKFLT